MVYKAMPKKPINKKLNDYAIYIPNYPTIYLSIRNTKTMKLIPDVVENDT